MELKLIRTKLEAHYTEGELWIDGKFFGFTMENKVIVKPGFLGLIFKAHRDTAIPAGRYPVVVTWSDHFKRALAGIYNVPVFNYVRIHSGSICLSSIGDIVISKKRIDEGMLLNEVATMNELIDLVQKKQNSEKIFITIAVK